MEARTLAVVGARARIAVGIAGLAAPRMAARIMGGRDGADGLTPLFVRMTGARDIVLGLGTVVALDRGAPVRGWLEGSAMADAADGLVSILGRDKLTPWALTATVAVATGSAIVGPLLGKRLDPPPPPDPGHLEAVATGHHPVTDA
ncbi:MAG TPA: hypothetical protein VFW09_06020 [Solirubrobacteraceae bacterium]|nr:hypothetical protein [Solirubrobacteraceae bacterium]